MKNNNIKINFKNMSAVAFWPGTILLNRLRKAFFSSLRGDIKGLLRQWNKHLCLFHWVPLAEIADVSEANRRYGTAVISIIIFDLLICHFTF